MKLFIQKVMDHKQNKIHCTVQVVLEMQINAARFFLVWPKVPMEKLH